MEEVAVAAATRRNGGEQGHRGGPTPLRTAKVEQGGTASRRNIGGQRPERVDIWPRESRWALDGTHRSRGTCTVDTAPYGGARLALTKGQPYPETLTTAGPLGQGTAHQKPLLFICAVRRRRRRGGSKGGEEEVPPCCSSSPPLLIQPARKQGGKIGKRRKKRWKRSKVLRSWRSA